MAVSCSLGFTKPINGIILHPGFATEQRGGDVLTSLDKDLFYEPNSKAVMLRPDLELKSMTLTTDGDGKAITKTGGSWELVTMPGTPELKLLHQKDVTAKNWSIKSTSDFNKNQGFVFYWTKYSTPSGSDSDVQISLGGIGAYSITITFYPREKTWIQYISTAANGVEYFSKEIPASFLSAEGEINSLICFFVDKYIILGINGIENIIAIQPSKTGSDDDANGVSYPTFTQGSSGFEVVISGAGVFGFKRLGFPIDATTGLSSGNLISPYFGLGKDNIPSASTTAKITKSIQPTGTSVTGYFAGGKPVEIEGTGGSGTGTGRLRYGFVLRGDGTVTPYLYSWRVKDPQTRSSATPDPTTLSADIIAYQEDISGNKDGSFGDWTSRIMITCYYQYYDTIFTGRNAKITINLNPGDGSVQRAVHYADTLVISREDPGGLTLDVSAQSIVKRLRLTPMLWAESFDDRGWRHGNLMSYLATLGGITLNAATYITDPLLPASQETDRPNWQFNPGTTIWDAMNTVREYSGWLLYPDNNNELTYKPFPTSASTADWTIDMHDCLDLKYTIGDLARTRFMVLGQSGSDDSAGRFKKGEGIFIYKTNSTLETALGESRPLWVFDPALSSIDVVNNMCNQLHDWYSALHKIISFTIPNFQAYKTMTLYQIVSISDADITDIDGKYLVAGLHISGDIALLTAQVELISLL